MRKQFEESPATMGLCVAWVVVFGLMVVAQSGLAQGDALFAGIRSDTALRFGAQRAALILDGQVWRPLTASFLHLSVLHLLINTAGLYQIGPTLESWYGSRQFLAIYVFTAWVGNLLAAGAKVLLLQRWPHVQAFQDSICAGGSVVLLGLIGLLAVVGGRSNTRFGRYVYGQMLGLLAFTAMLGVLMSDKFDNFGHAGGGVAGALVGLWHRQLIRRHDERRVPRWVGTAAVLLIVAAGMAQFFLGQRGWQATQTFNPRVESGRREAGVLMLVRLGQLYVEASHRAYEVGPPYDLVTGKPKRPPMRQITRALRDQYEALVRLNTGLGRGPTGPAFERIGQAVAKVEVEPPTPGESSQFLRDQQALIQQLLRELVELRKALPPEERAAPNRAAPAKSKPAQTATAGRTPRPSTGPLIKAAPGQ
jgi:rhomboid protease GluP